jgi:hypothetical protein
MHIQAQILSSKVPNTSLRISHYNKKVLDTRTSTLEAIGYSSIDSLSKTIKTYQVVKKALFWGQTNKKGS